MKNKAGRDVLQPRSRLRPNKKGSPGLQFVCALGTEHKGTSARGGRDQPRQFKREDAKQQEKERMDGLRRGRKSRCAKEAKDQQPWGRGGEIRQFLGGFRGNVNGRLTLFWAVWIVGSRPPEAKKKKKSNRARERERERERERQVRSSPTN